MGERLIADLLTENYHDDAWFEIDELLSTLDYDRRTAFVLTQLVGLSYEEAAETVGCAIGTIRSRLARARQQRISDEGLGLVTEA